MNFTPIFIVCFIFLIFFIFFLIFYVGIFLFFKTNSNKINNIVKKYNDSLIYFYNIDNNFIKKHNINNETAKKIYYKFEEIKKENYTLLKDDIKKNILEIMELNSMFKWKNIKKLIKKTDENLKIIQNNIEFYKSLYNDISKIIFINSNFGVNSNELLEELEKFTKNNFHINMIQDEILGKIEDLRNTMKEFSQTTNDKDKISLASNVINSFDNIIKIVGFFYSNLLVYNWYENKIIPAIKNFIDSNEGNDLELIIHNKKNLTSGQVELKKYYESIVSKKINDVEVYRKKCFNLLEKTYNDSIKEKNMKNEIENSKTILSKNVSTCKKYLSNLNNSFNEISKGLKEKDYDLEKKILLLKTEIDNIYDDLEFFLNQENINDEKFYNELKNFNSELKEWIAQLKDFLINVNEKYRNFINIFTSVLKVKNLCILFKAKKMKFNQNDTEWLSIIEKNIADLEDIENDINKDFLKNYNKCAMKLEECKENNINIKKNIEKDFVTHKFLEKLLIYLNRYTGEDKYLDKEIDDKLKEIGECQTEQSIEILLNFIHQIEHSLKNS